MKTVYDLIQEYRIKHGRNPLITGPKAGTLYGIPVEVRGKVWTVGGQVVAFDPEYKRKSREECRAEAREALGIYK